MAKTTKIMARTHIDELVDQVRDGNVEAAQVLSDACMEKGGVYDNNGVHIVAMQTKATKRLESHVLVGRFAAIVPGVRIELFGCCDNGLWHAGKHVPIKSYSKVFLLGDLAEYNSFNLVWMGPIQQITTKTVKVARGGSTGRVARDDMNVPVKGVRCSMFSIQQFDSKNWQFDVADTIRRNNETSRYL